MCGGTDFTGRSPTFSRGLSPRVRGNHRVEGDIGVGAGTIPACAGEPRSGADPLDISRDYPRVCGGTGPRSRGPTTIKGLSPRVRGNPIEAGLDRRQHGTIPACAGEPPVGLIVEMLEKDYPRVCGGTFVVNSHRNPLRGLSPRVRGNPISGWSPKTP